MPSARPRATATMTTSSRSDPAVVFFLVPTRRSSPWRALWEIGRLGLVVGRWLGLRDRLATVAVGGGLCIGGLVGVGAGVPCRLGFGRGGLGLGRSGGLGLRRG